MVTTPSRTCSAPEMQPRTHSGSLQWRHATAKLMPPGPSSIRDVRVHGGALERLHHVAFARIGKRAVILAQMAPKAPLFVHINTFHSLSLVPMHAGRAPLPGRARHRNGRRADQSTIYWSRSAPTETYLIFTPTASSINAIYSSASRGSSSFFRQPEISVRHPLNILLTGFACSSTSP